MESPLGARVLIAPEIKESYDKIIFESPARHKLVKFYEAAELTPEELATNLGKYLPEEVLFKGKIFPPELDARVVHLLTEATPNMPKNAEVAIHGTKEKFWEKIRTKGLEPGTNHCVAKDQIFHAKTAGRYYNALEDHEYTTLHYGTPNFFDTDPEDCKTCRFVISLLPKSYTPHRGCNPIHGRLVSATRYTIPLWMVEIDTYVFAELIIRKYGRAGKPSCSDTKEQINKILKLYERTTIADYCMESNDGKPCGKGKNCPVCKKNFEL